MPAHCHGRCVRWRTAESLLSGGYSVRRRIRIRRASSPWHAGIAGVSTVKQSGAVANFGNRTYRQIWLPNVNNNIYILTHEYSSTGFE